MQRRIIWTLMSVALLLALSSACASKPASHVALVAPAAASPTARQVIPTPTATEAPTSTPMPPPTATPAQPPPTPSRSAAPTPTANTFTCEATTPDQYRTCHFTEAGGDAMTFYLWVPDQARGQHYPLVLLLHGGGERASATSTPEQNRDRLLNDPYAQVWGPGYPGPDDPGVQQHWPSFVVVPQVEDPGRWVNLPANHGSYDLAPAPSAALRMAKEIVDAVQLAYPSVDPARHYITGLSMGGYGVWEAIERWPGEFAAAAPICGGGDPADAAALIDLPIWAFQGADDPIVPVAASRDMIAAIEAAGGHPRYTEYPNGGHGVWTIVYQILGQPSPTTDFYTWLFAQHR